MLSDLFIDTRNARRNTNSKATNLVLRSLHWIILAFTIDQYQLYAPMNSIRGFVHHLIGVVEEFNRLIVVLAGRFLRKEHFIRRNVSFSAFQRLWVSEAQNEKWADDPKSKYFFVPFIQSYYKHIWIETDAKPLEMKHEMNWTSNLNWNEEIILHRSRQKAATMTTMSATLVTVQRFALCVLTFSLMEF